MTDNDFTEETEVLPEQEVNQELPIEEENTVESIQEELTLKSDDINSEQNSRTYEALAAYASVRDAKSDSMLFKEQPTHVKQNNNTSPVTEAVKSVDEAFKSSSDITDKIYFAILAMVTLFDLFAAHLFMRKQGIFISEKILEALGFDSIKMTGVTFSQLSMGVGYFVSLFAGGIIILVLLKILTKLFTRFNVVPKSNYIPVLSVVVFLLVFIIGFIFAFVKNDTLLSSSVYNWGCPAMAYAGGLIFYFASKLHVGIEY